jgi:hypothetical protein
MAAGSGCLAAARLTSPRLMHLSLPHDALFLLIITVGIVVIVLGCRVIVYFERRDQHRHEIISDMQEREDVYQDYEGSSSRYVSWPVTTAPRIEESSRRSRPSQSGRAGLRIVEPLNRYGGGPATEPERMLSRFGRFRMFAWPR